MNAIETVQDLLEKSVTAIYEAVADEKGLACSTCVASLLPAAKAAKDGGMPGLAMVLGLQLRGLSDPLRKQATLDSGDAVALANALSEVQMYLSGQYRREDVPALVEGLRALPWIPALKAEIQGAIVAQLQDAPWLNDAPPEVLETVLGSSDEAAEPDAATHDAANVAGHGVEPAGATPSEATSAWMGQESADERPAEGVTPPPSYDPREPWSMHEQRAADATEHVPETIRWIAQEELELLAQALTGQLLPVTQELYAADAAARVDVLQRIADEAHLVGQAFEVMNLPQLKASVDHLETNLELMSADPMGLGDVTQSVLGEWAVLLLAVLEQPGDQNLRGALRDGLCSIDWPLPFADWPALEAELLEIRFGIDPALIASRKSEASPADVTLEFASDLAPAVLDGMLRELPGNVAELSARMHRLVKSGNEDDIDVARRIAHTLKGDANIVGLRGIANLTHALEDILVELKRQPMVPPPALADALIEASDCVEAMADYVLRRGPLPDQALDVYQHILHWANLALDKKLLDAESAEARPEGSLQSLSQAAKKADEPEGAPASVPPATATEPSLESVPSMSVPVPVLDQLLRLAGESMVVTRQLEQLLGRLKRQQRELQDNARLSERLHQELEDLVAVRGAALQSTQASAGAMDPLEMDQYNDLHTVSKRLIEAGADQKGYVSGLTRVLTEFNDLLAEQDQVQDTLQGAVLRTRMIPVESLVPRLKRTVRQTARAVLKDCELYVVGQDLQVDSDILAGLTDPLMHALRNAVDHGIEASEERSARGKPEQGEIRLTFARDGAFVLVELEDDGRGLDLARIRSKAIERGLIAENEELDDEQLTRLILLPGFSTREQTSQISGRGIGMDVVASEVRALKGTLQLQSTFGRGMRLSIRVPASLLSAQVLVCDLPSGRVALATDRIERLQMVQPFELSQGPNGLRIQYLGQYAPAVELDALCFHGDVNQADLARSWIGMVVRDLNGKPVVALAPQLGEAVNVLVKPLGSYVQAIAGVRGTCVLGDGSAACVVDLPDLVAERQAEQPGSRVIRQRVVRTLPRAVVADDSLSVRRALSQLLQDAGYEVAAVRDGLEALGEINRKAPDILLVDLEMPQLNGLEVCSFLRNTEGLRDIPVVMITSRSGERHQQMAKDAGVNVLLTKPYSDDHLLQTVQELLAK